MKKSLSVLLLIVLSLNCYSQISFEEGYFIDDTGKKITCLIKNIDWKDNPTEFKYRLSKNSDPIKATIESVKEFSVNNNSKYIRSTVNIDRSTDNLSNLSKVKEPIFKEEELFLKVLVEGNSNLYEYVQSNLKRYFYSKENSDIEQLIFKSYKTDENIVRKNNRFRQQLAIELKCQSFETDKFKNLDYKRDDLVKYFIEYGDCNNIELINFVPKQKRDLFNLTIRPRLNSSSLTIENFSADTRNVDFENKLGFGFGLEAEFILPFNKNKWAILVEPTYQSFKSETTMPVSNVSGGVLNSKVNYTSIETPVSLRHYFFLNKNSKIFIDASFIFDISPNSSIEFTREDGSALNSLKIVTRNNLAMGIGYKQNDRFSLEIRYQTSREILSDYLYVWNSDYRTLSVILGYSLF